MKKRYQSPVVQNSNEYIYEFDNGKNIKVENKEQTDYKNIFD